VRAIKIATTYYLQQNPPISHNSAQPVRVLLSEKTQTFGSDLSPVEKMRRMAICGRKPLPQQTES
jgi:hypothetical protein